LDHWSGEDKQKAKAMEDSLDNWKTACAAEVPAIKKKMAKRNAYEAPIFAEPTVALEEWLLARLRQSPGTAEVLWKSALWLSDTQKSGRPGNGVCMDTRRARQTTEDLTRSKEGAAKLMRDIGKTGTVIWAPKEADHCSRLLGNLQAAVSDPAVLAEVLLVCDRPVMPFLDDPDLLEDFWKTPMLHQKWRHILADLIHLKEPVLLTTAIQEKHAVVTRSVSLARVSGRAQTVRPQWASWTATMHAEEESWVVIVEVEAAKHLLIRKGLHGLAVHSGLQWEGPYRSPGTTQQQDRLCFRLYPAKASYSELGVCMLIKSMRGTGFFQDAFIGNEAMLKDKGARVLEVTQMAAAAGFSHMIDEALVIGGTELLIYTADSQTEWEDQLTEAVLSEPAMAGLQVRWRRCTNGGRAWAKPRLDDTVVQAASRRARRPLATADKEDDQGQVRLRGPLGAHPDQLLAKVMQAIGDKVGVRWSPQTNNKALDRYKWRLQLGHDGKPTGKVDFRLGGCAEVEALQRAVNADVVQVNGAMALLDVYSEVLAARRLPVAS
jgi:hypothetical protein